MDAFKRIDRSTREKKAIPFTGLSYNIYLSTTYICKHLSVKKKMFFLSFARRAIIFMACAHLRFSHAHTSNQNYRATIYLIDDAKDSCFHSIRQPSFFHISLWYTFDSPGTLSLGARLHFVRLCLFMCVCVCVSITPHRKRSNFPNAWLWILLILSEQVHQFAIHIIVLCVGKVCTQEIPKYNILMLSPLLLCHRHHRRCCSHLRIEIMCKPMRKRRRPNQLKTNKRKWTNANEVFVRCVDFVHISPILTW